MVTRPIHAAGEFHVVGRDEGREAGGADELRQRVEHMARGVRVEIAGRLVGEQDARGIGDRAGDRDALLLAAGQFRGPVLEPLLQTEIAQQLGRALAAPPRATGRGSSAAA